MNPHLNGAMEFSVRTGVLAAVGALAFKLADAWKAAGFEPQGPGRVCVAHQLHVASRAKQLVPGPRARHYLTVYLGRLWPGWKQT